MMSASASLQKLDLVHLPKNRVLYEAGEPMHQAYSLNTGMAALLATTEEGQSIEIATVGNEGFVGIPISSDSLRRVLLRYAHVLEAQMVQSVVCHLLHNVSQRVCRYLLVTSDCLQSDELSLTQEEIADVLSTDRSQVGLAAGILREKGIIHYRRGNLTIRDRKGLEAEIVSTEIHIRRGVAWRKFPFGRKRKPYLRTDHVWGAFYAA